MDALGLLVTLVILGIIGVVAYRVFATPGSGAMLRRAQRLAQPAAAPGAAVGARQPTLETLQPGDAVSFWDKEDEIVDAVLECREELGGRVSTWRWVLLTRRVLEVAPDENALYEHGHVLYQGSEPFYALTADPAEGGALKTFEARVRAETIARNPVTVQLEDKEWTVDSTGTFRGRWVGTPTRQEVWRDVSENPADNVYFEMSRTDPSGDREIALGLWTSHILVLTGRPLATGDVENLYPGQGGAGQHDAGG